MPGKLYGVMQGRLSPPEDGRFQSFPRNSWREEFSRAQAAGLDYIEWIYDDYGATANPIGSEQGVAELNALKRQHGIATPALCADWLMEFPVIRCSAAERAQREEVLRQLLRRARQIEAWRLVLPFVDSSSMQTEDERQIVVDVIGRALPVAEEVGVEMHLEADLAPRDFAAFLECIPHPMVRVNYDSGNSSGLGYVASEEFAAYGKRIGSIHIKDRQRFPDGKVATRPLGEGSADFDDIFASIRGIGYSGGLTLQVARGEDGDETNWIRRQLAFVRSRWSDADGSPT